MVEGQEVKRYKNIDLPDMLKEVEMLDFHFNVAEDGKITFEISYAQGILPEVFPEPRAKMTRPKRQRPKRQQKPPQSRKPKKPPSRRRKNPKPRKPGARNPRTAVSNMSVPAAAPLSWQRARSM